MEQNLSAVGAPVEPTARPCAWWRRAGDQFSTQQERPFAECFEPLYDQAAITAAVAEERARCARLAEGEKFKDGRNDARRGPRGVGTWHESSPMGYAMRELARAIRGA